MCFSGSTCLFNLSWAKSTSFTPTTNLTESDTTYSWPIVFSYIHDRVVCFCCKSQKLVSAWPETHYTSPMFSMHCCYFHINLILTAQIKILQLQQKVSHCGHTNHKSRVPKPITGCFNLNLGTQSPSLNPAANWAGFFTTTSQPIYCQGGRKSTSLVQLNPDALTTPKLGDNFCHATHIWGYWQL